MYTDGKTITPASVAPPKPTKSEAVITRIRHQIIAGLQPETKLASFSEMEQAYGVSRTVLREVVSQLKREGFIYSVNRQGLYVSGRPPHLSRFAMVFASNPSAPDWPRFYTALKNEAVGLERERGDIELASYYDVAGGPGTDNYDRLLDDVRAHRVAGLMLLPPGHELGQTEPFASLPVPKLYIFGSKSLSRVPSVATEELGLADRMVQWLRERGRRRIAVVALWGSGAAQHDHLRAQGVPYRSHWFQRVARDNVADVRGIVKLLMDYPIDERPDGLIILDDNLTEHAVGGVLDSGLTVGREIDVIAHCNWPWPVASTVPIQRVGFHAGHILRLAVRAIELQRQDRPLATEQAMVPPLFEEEVNRPWRAGEFDTSSED